MIRGFAGVDLDRLADYAAGLLTGAAAADVARLIRTDPGWSAAYQSLPAADEAVRWDLRQLARSHLEPMPASVAARLDAALRTGWSGAGAAPPAQVKSLTATRASRRRLAAVTAAAAAAITIAAGAWVAGDIVGGRYATDRAATVGSEAGAPDGGQAPPAVGPGVGPTLPIVLASGTDYRQPTLGQLAARVPVRFGPSGDRAEEPSSPAATADAWRVPALSRDLAGPLARLTDPVSLRTCLDAIAAVYPGTAGAVDFARFEGGPALIVLIRREDGSATVAAVGPDCGLAGDPDARAAAPA